MARIVHLATSAVLLALCACQSAAPSSGPIANRGEPKVQPSVAASVVAKKAHEHFGAPLGSEPEVDFAQLLAKPDANTERDVQVEGVVRQVCQNAGCWLELATDMKAEAPGCRVVLKDHAFFVPIDSAGSRARIAGRLEKKTISPAMVAHMESEGGHFSGKQADGSAIELRMVASGVELARK